MQAIVYGLPPELSAICTQEARTAIILWLPTLQHLSTTSDQEYGVASSEYTCYVHRSILAQAVAHNDVWLDS